MTIGSVAIYDHEFTPSEITDTASSDPCITHDKSSMYAFWDTSAIPDGSTAGTIDDAAGAQPGMYYSVSSSSSDPN